MWEGQSPQRLVEGDNGKGAADYLIEMLSGPAVGDTEVKREDITAGVAQNMVQIEAVLNGIRRRAGENPIKLCFGVVLTQQSGDIWRSAEW